MADKLLRSRDFDVEKKLAPSRGGKFDHVIEHVIGNLPNPVTLDEKIYSRDAMFFRVGYYQGLPFDARDQARIHAHALNL